MPIFIILIAIFLNFTASYSYAESKLPLPRFASLRSDEVNVRTGPGQRYKIKWMFKKTNLPVEIVGEFEQWRKIADSNGDEGWVHRSMLQGKRTILITGENLRLMHRSPDDSASLVAKVEPGVIAEVTECNLIWCRLRIKNVKGWLKKTDFWGVYDQEVID